MLVALAVTRRAAHVRCRDRVPPRDEVLRQGGEAGSEPWEPLRLRTAVHRHDDRERPVAVRLEEEHGHGLAIEAVEAMQGRLDEVSRLDLARAGREARQR